MTRLSIETKDAAVPVEGRRRTTSWYVKFFEYWKNRNRVGPSKVELPDCDFFILGPRRTLRIFKPPSEGENYYCENAKEEATESINDNFFARWSKRPHSPDHCRCSFRQSTTSRFGNDEEERIISAELERIRSNLREAEKAGRNIEELEQRISVNLDKLQNTIQVSAETRARQNRRRTDEKRVDDRSKKLVSDSIDDVDDRRQTNDQNTKNKIVKDLEKFINVLLEEMVDDTVEYIAASESVLTIEEKLSKKEEKEEMEAYLDDTEKLRKIEKVEPIEKLEIERSSDDKGFFNDLSFSFHALDDVVGTEPETKIERRKGEEGEISNGEGYVNCAFIGSATDPDSMDFYLRCRPKNNGIGRAQVTLEQLDCTDSGINSVETIEFQPDQEPSLEQSLLRIIDEKLGRTSLINDREETRCVDAESRRVRSFSKSSSSTILLLRNDEEEIDDDEKEPERSEEEQRITTTIKSVEERNDDKSVGDLSFKPTDDDEISFEKTRLELKDDIVEEDIEETVASKKSTTTTVVSKLRERFCSKLDKSQSDLDKNCNTKKLESTWNERDDYRKKWSERIDETTKFEDVRHQRNPRDFVTSRKNKKPTIVFLHGFGSTAEIFQRQLQYFSALGYPCIAPDLLGHGMSSAPDRSKDYHFDELLKDLDTVLHCYAFKPGQKCVLVGHNYGCSFATALACKYDSNIHQLVLISGGGPIPLAPPTKEGTGRCCLRAILTPLLTCGLHRDMLLYTARGRQHPYCGTESIEQWPSHMKYVLDGMIWPEGDYVLHRRISTPTLLIHGLRDNMVSLVQECQMERTMMKAFLEAIPTAGHDPMTDSPEQINHMIHCFIDLWKDRNAWQ